MGKTSQQLIHFLNRFTKTKNRYYDAQTKGDEAAFAYSMRAGKIIYRQFDGYNNFDGKTIVDFGCGKGGKSLYYATLNVKRVIGIDVVNDFDMASKKARDAKLPLEFVAMDSHGNIPHGDDSVDIVIASNVLEHVEEPEATVKQLARIIKPGGLFLNRWHPFKTRYGSHLSPNISIPFAHYFFSEKDIIQCYYREMLDRYGKVPASETKISEDSRDFSDLQLHLNRADLHQIADCLRGCGFRIEKTRYFRDTKEIRFIEKLPLRLRPLFFDYEIQICKKT